LTSSTFSPQASFLKKVGATGFELVCTRPFLSILNWLSCRFCALRSETPMWVRLVVFGAKLTSTEGASLTPPKNPSFTGWDS
jgi:hypothetical protein